MKDEKNKKYPCNNVFVCVQISPQFILIKKYKENNKIKSLKIINTYFFVTFFLLLIHKLID